MMSNSSNHNSNSNPNSGSRGLWNILSEPTIERNYGAGGTIINKNQFLVIGGMDSNSRYLKSGEHFDRATDTWTTFPVDMPTGRANFGIVTYVRGGVPSNYTRAVFVVGGRIDGKETNVTCSADVLCFDFSEGGISDETSTREWKWLTPMKQARANFACASCDGDIYVFGGRGKNGDGDEEALDTAEMYNIYFDEWVQLPEMPGKRWGCAAAVIGNKIYLIGGCDDESNDLSSVLVYDVVEEDWDYHSVPDMTTARSDLSVVVVADRYIVAIGGWNGDNNDETSCIEVLDILKNEWRSAASPTEHDWDTLTAGVFEGTNEIIIAGKGSVESIDFDVGLKPRAFKQKQVSAPKANYFSGRQSTELWQKNITEAMPEEKDKLNMKTIAEVLTDSLITKDLKSPLTLGVFGKWGRGKSFFFDMMLEHIIKIQKRQSDIEFQDTYAGHVYVIRFNAWTHSKSDIMSSLVYKILRDLDEQLQFEEAMGINDLIAGKLSTLQVFLDFAMQDVGYLETYYKNIVLYQEVKNKSDRPSERLLNAINTSYLKDKEDLKLVKKRIRWCAIEREATLARDSINIFLNFMGRFNLVKALNKALKDNDPDSNKTTDPKNIIRDFDKSFERFKWFNFNLRHADIPAYAYVCSALFLILSIVLAHFQTLRWGWSIASTVLSFVLPLLTGFASVRRKAEATMSEFKDRAIMANDLEAGICDVDNEIDLLKNEEMDIESRIFGSEGCSLRQTVTTEFSSRNFDKVQRDLQRITTSMLKKAGKKDVFPRGDPRIVLIVDDLDRCEKRIVVEVIEAVQLLVDSKLFVAVIDTDPRYATQALEDHYKGVSEPHAPPTGIDFLEKIIQIPFRLPGVGMDHVDAFVDSQIKESTPEKPAQIVDVTPDNPPVESPVSARDLAPVEYREPNVAIGDIYRIVSDSESGSSDEDELDDASSILSSVTEAQESFNLPSNKVSFTGDEVKMLKEILRVFRLEPRYVNRIMIIFKVVLVIWRRNNFKVDDDMKRATLFLMLLATNDSTREVTHKIYDWMESGRTKYHQVMWEDIEGVVLVLKERLTLADLFLKEMRRRDNKFVSSTNEGTLVASVEKYLKAYEWTNVEEWNKVSSDFLLARCFSFFRLNDDHEMDNQGIPNPDKIM